MTTTSNYSPVHPNIKGASMPWLIRRPGNNTHPLAQTPRLIIPPPGSDVQKQKRSYFVIIIEFSLLIENVTKDFSLCTRGVLLVCVCEGAVAFIMDTRFSQVVQHSLGCLFTRMTSKHHLPDLKGASTLRLQYIILYHAGVPTH